MLLLQLLPHRIRLHKAHCMHACTPGQCLPVSTAYWAASSYLKRDLSGRASCFCGAPC